MSDDIVNRLRGWEVEPYPVPVGACIRNGAVMEEAADEIERLRKEVNRLHREMDMELFGESEYEEDE